MYSFLLTFTTFKEKNMITLEDYKSKIISHRTLSEEKVRKFKEGYDKLEDPKAIFGDLEIPEDFTLKLMRVFQVHQYIESSTLLCVHSLISLMLV